MHAEDAYLFRHAIVRDAAYQMQLPTDRSHLHSVSLSLLQDAFTEREKYVFAGELSEHARLAQHAAGSENDHLSELDLLYLNRAVTYSESTYHLNNTLLFTQRIFNHPLSTQEDRILIMWKACHVLLRLGRFDEAEVKAKIASALVDSGGNDVLRSTSAFHLARAIHAQGRLNEAEDLYLQTIRSHEQHGDKNKLPEVLLALSALLWATDRREEAETTYLRGIKISNELGLSDLSRRLESNLAACRASMGHHAEAEDMLLAIMKTYQAGGKLSAKAHCLSNLGAISFDTGRLESACGYFSEAIGLLRTTGDQLSLTNCLGNLGATLQRLGRCAESETRLSEALKIAEDCEMLPQQWTALDHMGRLYSGSGRYSDSRESFLRAKNIGQMMKSDSRVGMALRGLAWLHWRDCDHEEAESAYRGCIRLISDDHREAAGVYCSLASVLVERGRVDEGKSVMTKSLSLARPKLRAELLASFNQHCLDAGTEPLEENS
jgi:tetratricopeptide (TPR) repeat protein